MIRQDISYSDHSIIPTQTKHQLLHLPDKAKQKATATYSQRRTESLRDSKKRGPGLQNLRSDASSVRCGTRNKAASLQVFALLPCIDGQEVYSGASGDGAPGGLPELHVFDPRHLGGLRICHQLNVDVHAEQAHDHNARGDHHRRRREHHAHLQQLVLLLVQHQVDVVFSVVHIVAELYALRRCVLGC